MDNIYSSSRNDRIITPGNNPEGSIAMSDISRVLPRQLSTGSTRGTQTVGYGQTKIDGSNNRITLGSGIILDGDNETISISDSQNTVLTVGKSISGTFNFRVLDADGVGLAQFGQFPDGSIALKVAQAGIEVATATPAQLIFNSNQDIFKIASSGISSIIPALNIDTEVIIPHNLGFVPVPFVFINNSSGFVPLPFSLDFVNSVTGRVETRLTIAVSSVNATNLVIIAQNADTIGPTQTFDIKYYLLQETASV